MLPILSSNYIANAGTGHSIHSSQLPVGKLTSGFKPSDFQNGSFGKFSAIFSLPFVGTVRPDHIIHIILTTAWFQMIGVTARRVVTKVAYQGVFGNRTVGKSVGQTMGGFFSFYAAHLSVTFIVFSGFPLPAKFGGLNVNFIPETFKGVFCLILAATLWAAQKHCLSVSLKFLTAHGANLNHKKSSLSSEARGKQTWYNPVAFDLPYRLIAMPRLLLAARGFSMPILPYLRSK